MVRSPSNVPYIQPLDVRTWLACHEARERRRFLGRGRTPTYTVAEVAELCYDPDAGIYGNWVNNTLGASHLGVPMLATRLASWRELEVALEHGPVVLSLPPFTPETLGGVTYESKSGHLLVARGFDDQGDVLVSDH